MDLLLGHAQSLGDEAVPVLAQGLQVVLGDPDGQVAVLVPPLELEHQALGEVPGAHTGGLQALDHRQGLLHHLHGLLHLRGQILQGLVQPAVLVEGLHQEAPCRQHLRRKLHDLELREHI